MGVSQSRRLAYMKGISKLSFAFIKRQRFISISINDRVYNDFFYRGMSRGTATHAATRMKTGNWNNAARTPSYGINLALFYLFMFSSAGTITLFIWPIKTLTICIKKIDALF